MYATDPKKLPSLSELPPAANGNASRQLPSSELEIEKASETTGPISKTIHASCPHIAVIDPRNMLRECVVRFVTDHQRLTALGYGDIDEMINCKQHMQIFAVLLYATASSRRSIFEDMTKLRSCNFLCPIIVMIDISDSSFIRELLNHGARGIIPTVFPANVALEAIHLVLAGGIYAPVESFFREKQKNPENFGALTMNLTPREGQIVELLRSGKANKQIAYELDLSLGTVKIHLHNIMKKLGVHNRLQVLAMDRSAE